ncbi:hypothetical protein O7606_16705 [Micromonospora sp. WMMD882]|uniref:hypothetical protein n=1 Tax=Micromonospora sp. WMMD882 TaxID=3015151 RepID=UPI00248A997E|nr:hypothetical protein [Micromonospora sp. WMMD882]WBB77903.1 hypothetical protein O7606_16705 [Micromonospora sp. WMMD882]
MPVTHPVLHGLSRFTCALLVAAVPLAACASNDEGGSSTDSPTRPVNASGSGGPPSPGLSSSAATSAPSGIPASALLQPSDVRGAEPQPMEDGDRGHLRPLRPCGTEDTYPSDESRTAAVAVSFFVEPATTGATPTVIVEFVGRHARGGAADQFDDVEEALQRCPGSLAEGDRRWTVIGSDIAGDESLLVRIDEKLSYGDGEPSTVSDYAAVARAGDMIVVVTDTGWENADSSEQLVRELAAKAVRRAGTAWRDVPTISPQADGHGS